MSCRIKRREKMNDEQQTVSEQEQEQTQSELMKAFLELKKNSVSLDAYNKLKDENKELVNCIVEGKDVDIEQPPVKVDCDELRKKLFSGNLNNLEYAETALTLRNEIIKQGGRDPFLPYGVEISPTKMDVDAAEEVADALESCIEVAQGDPDVFTNELQRIMVETRPKIRR